MLVLIAGNSGYFAQLPARSAWLLLAWLLIGVFFVCGLFGWGFFCRGGFLADG